jgi:hypothetical protein
MKMDNTDWIFLISCLVGIIVAAWALWGWWGALFTLCALHMAAYQVRRIVAAIVTASK